MEEKREKSIFRFLPLCACQLEKFALNISNISCQSSNVSQSPQQTTSKNSQRYYTTKRLIRDLLSDTPTFYVHAGEFRGFIYGECVTEVCEAERNWRGKSS